MNGKFVNLIADARLLTIRERGYEIYKVQSAIAKCIGKTIWLLSDNISVDILDESGTVNKIVERFKKDICTARRIKSISDDVAFPYTNMINFCADRYQDDSLLFRYLVGYKESQYYELVIKNYDNIIVELGVSEFLHLLQKISEIMKVTSITTSDKAVVADLQLNLGSNMKIEFL
jgi:hypothetical protein